MVAVIILIVLVTVLSVYSAFGTYQNTQDIKALADVTKGIGVNAKHICQILEMLKEQEDIINQYHKADTFLEIHGWKWNDNNN